MGWNSWDCWGAGVDEKTTRANTDYMAEKLKPYGWEYVVVDIQWYEPKAHTTEYRKDAFLTLDANGRLLPAPNRFPSAEGGKGFKPLADYVHSKGLKFGIHLLRGIPRQAVRENLPILGTTPPLRARDIANTNSICHWNTDMYGIDMSKPGAQEYYDSVFALIASWDVDFVKVDDLSRPYFDNIKEIEAIRKAIDKTGRPMLLSTSPGETPLTAADHVSTHANMWRTSDDFWDNWKLLKDQFKRAADWAPHTVPGAYPDHDMIPFGRIRAWQPKDKGGWTKFTKDEQYTFMNLWSISRSPLMFGGNLPDNDDFTLSLLTNKEVIALNQHSRNGRQVFRKDDLIAWTAEAPDGSKYLALFNARDKGEPAEVSVNLSDIGITSPAAATNLWTGEAYPAATNFAQTLAPHASVLVKFAK